MRKTRKTQPAKMVTVRIQADTRQQLKVEAAKLGISMATAMARLVNLYEVPSTSV